MYFIRLQYGQATDLLYSVKGKYSYLEPTLVSSSQNCRTIRTKCSLTWGLLLWNEVTQWNKESNGLPWALPDFIPTWHVSQQVPGLRFSPLSSRQPSCSSWKSQLWNESLSALLLRILGICKVNICSSHFSLSSPALPFFLFKWKQAFTWRKNRPLNIWNSSVLDFH